MTKLEEKQEEYINFLGGELNKLTAIQQIRGFNTSQEIIDKGIKLRDEIENLKTDYVPFVSEVEEFNHKMGKPNNYEPIIPEEKEWKFVYDFVLEEIEEYREACEKGDIVGILDAIGDLLYVAVGNSAMLHGLKYKVQDAYQEIQASNLSKCCETEELAKETAKVRSEELNIETHYEKVGDTYVVYRSSDRKVMKSINYFKPNLEQFFTTEELQKIHHPSTII